MEKKPVLAGLAEDGEVPHLICFRVRHLTPAASSPSNGPYSSRSSILLNYQDSSNDGTHRRIE